MSDTTQTVLDPKRPWLTDPRELPSQMNWVQTLFNPTGESPKLHFTRAWTLLFFLQLLVIVIPFSVALVLDMAGGDGKPVGMIGVYATPVVFIVTTLMSYVIHTRRLNDAGKPALLALLPLLPLVLAMGAFMVAAGQQATQYDKRFEMRQEYLADPDAFRAKQKEQQDKSREAAEAKAAESGEDGTSQAGGGAEGQQHAAGAVGPGGHPLNLDKPMDPKAQTVLKAALPTIQYVMIPLSALVAVWSLLWVARVPYFGTYPGPASSGSGEGRRAYEA
ncbi:DUF805 domain-containing protein [Henriciella aquimarina]|uniref:DUF805 domain-containing protein n=1 Tax=Henriciella aquimarina TaxID=545261 RepID=UPI000A073650|nr:DUF805 domain-containing protein [Henriciella aquimarina]